MRLAWKTLAVLALAVLVPTLTFAQYTRTDLVTNSGAGGTVQDAHLVNAWGLVSTTTSPFWVSDNRDWILDALFDQQRERGQRHAR